MNLSLLSLKQGFLQMSTLLIFKFPNNFGIKELSFFFDRLFFTNDAYIFLNGMAGL